MNPSKQPHKATPKGSNATFSVAGLNGWSCLCALLLLLLVLSATYHQSIIGDLNRYRTSPAIAVEFVCLSLAIVSVPIHLIRAVVLMVSKKPRQALMSFVIGVGTCVVIGWVLWYDAPTLLYMT